MVRFLGYLFVTIICSMYIFPIELAILPSVNTKMVMAVLGIVVYLYNVIAGRGISIQNKIIFIGISALSVSFCGLISVLYNETNDFTYALYFVSFAVWLSASYFVVTCMRRLHGIVSLEIVCRYLIAVALLQCVLAILIDFFPSFKIGVNKVVVGFASMYSAGSGIEKAGRLYGIGAALDVAGSRFCAILAMCGFFLSDSYQSPRKSFQWFYILSFGVILVVGSMISRTTILGLLLIICYWFFVKKWIEIINNKRFISAVIILLLLCVYLYKESVFFYENARFAFEGFFNWWERGYWETNSTNTLSSMYKFPDNLKTWIIGDGYFDEPYIGDPYYIGESRSWGLFYMGTDVGYCRFIFYFGLLGLLSFVGYFIYCARCCILKLSQKKWVILLLLLLNFLIWFKVATDIFCLFALFLCVSKEENDEYELKRQLEIQELENGR